MLVATESRVINTIDVDDRYRHEAAAQSYADAFMLPMQIISQKLAKNDADVEARKIRIEVGALTLIYLVEDLRQVMEESHKKGFNGRYKVLRDKFETQTYVKGFENTLHTEHSIFEPEFAELGYEVFADESKDVAFVPANDPITKHIRHNNGGLGPNLFNGAPNSCLSLMPGMLYKQPFQTNNPEMIEKMIVQLKWGFKDSELPRNDVIGEELKNFLGAKSK
ncbi:MAG: hypothetical protein FWD15_06195 [Alphaproteobacteria bacterium]|nr:hypothetical protein [Alphaproteobacteria bacterium]